MRKLSFFVLISFIFIGFMSAQTINVTSPHAGKTWYKGQTYTIRWTKTGTMGKFVKIKLRNSNSTAVVLDIISHIPNNGSNKWPIPASVAPGKYVLRVRTEDNKVYGDSGTFTVTDPPAAASIIVSDPHSGTEWCKGSTHNITWTKTGNAGVNVKINIFKNSINSANSVEQLTGPNNGSKSWPISASYTNGAYIIRIKGVDKSGNDVGVFDNSNFFTISSLSGTIITPTLPPSISVIDPHSGDTWYVGNPVIVKWNFVGDIGPNVKIVLFQNSIKKVDINLSAPAAAKMFTWNIPLSVQPGKYQVRISSLDDKISSTSSTFLINKLTAIPNPPQYKVLQIKKSFQPITRATVNPNQNVFNAGKNIRFYSPKAGYIWKPLSDYNITFEVFKNKWPYSEFYVDVLLISADPGKFFMPFLLKENLHTYSRDSKNSYIYGLKWKFLGDYNIPSGKYKIKIKSRLGNRYHESESDVFSIDNKISSNTAFLGQDQSDLIFEDVYYDFYTKSILARIRNQGFAPFSGDIKVSYSFIFGRSFYAGKACSASSDSGSKIFKSVSIPKYQTKTLNFYKYSCFDKRPSDFYPKRGPMKYTVNLSAAGKKSSSKSGMICKTKKSDIATGDSIHIYYDTGHFNYVSGKTTISPNAYNWDRSGKTFETEVSVRVYNWGCQTRTFKINLHMDGPYLNGKNGITIGTVTLKPGEEKFFKSGKISFSIPKDSTYRRILLVADQDENTNQGYPNSYKNNFILAYIRIFNEDNTIRGVVNW